MKRDNSAIFVVKAFPGRPSVCNLAFAKWCMLCKSQKSSFAGDAPPVCSPRGCRFPFFAIFTEKLAKNKQNRDVRCYSCM